MLSQSILVSRTLTFTSSGSRGAFAPKNGDVCKKVELNILNFSTRAEYLGAKAPLEPLDVKVKLRKSKNV